MTRALSASRLALLLLLLLIRARHTLGLSPGGGEERLRRAQAFLAKYGYTEEDRKGGNPLVLTEAIRTFQWVSHLPVNGHLDEATVHQMSMPRCGVKDIKGYAQHKEEGNALFTGRRHSTRRVKRYSLRYTLHSKKWHKRHLTYRIENWPEYLSELQVRQAVKAAFQLWGNVSSLTFWEARDGSADIRLSFFHGDHNDGTNNAFDGPGGALAHAFFPLRGEAHFDKDERWALNSKGRNLFVVLAHEIGHTLGLEHSPFKSALMSPYYKKLGKAFVLSLDDVLAIQNLYGKPAGAMSVQLPGSQFMFFPDWSAGQSEHGNTNPGSYYCKFFFDAITMDINQNIYVFKGQHFWMVSKDGHVSKPQLLHQKWIGLPAFVEAAAVSGVDGKFYFFKGGRCWRYSASLLDTGFSMKCSSRGLPRHPDAAFHFQLLGHVVVFKGPKYYVLNEGSMLVEPYYPRSLLDWSGVPSGINGVLSWADGFLYFFKDDRYWRFDQSKLKVNATGKWAEDLKWMGC